MLEAVNKLNKIPYQTQLSYHFFLPWHLKNSNNSYLITPPAWLAQLGERRSAEREVVGSNPGRTNTQGL